MTTATITTPRGDVIAWKQQDDPCRQAQVFSARMPGAFVARVPLVAHVRHWTPGDCIACYRYEAGQRVDAWREAIPNPAPEQVSPDQLGLFAQ
jgi:hypothetical protein